MNNLERELWHSREQEKSLTLRLRRANEEIAQLKKENEILFKNLVIFTEATIKLRKKL